MINKKGQVFTPKEYVKKLLDEVDYEGKVILNKVFLENSVGSGNILLEAISRYLIVAEENDISVEIIKKKLQTNFIAFDIDGEVIQECKNKLDELALNFGVTGVQWNIINDNYLEYKKKIEADYIVGNPPYLTYRDLDIHERESLKSRFKSCEHGKFDYCYAFIEKSLEDLKKESGKMSYLIPSSIFKNTFGTNLRKLMLSRVKKIVDFQHRNVFESALISPAIFSLDNSYDDSQVVYSSPDINHDLIIPKVNFKDKWIFSDKEVKEEGYKSFGDYFEVVNSVATLLNEAFVIQNFTEESERIIADDIILEAKGLRKACSPRSKSINRNEKIIFPYKYDLEGNLVRYTEKEFLNIFPNVALYLKKYSEKLGRRKADGYWFEYGRIQGLRLINQPKIMISSIITDSVKAYKLEKEEIPYSGFFIVPKKELSLEEAYQMLTSAEMYEHLLERAINANGRSIRISVKDIKDFPLKSDLFK
ncbi:N-6 DNA methylase [Lactococcus lactis]|uniref:Eco57I restriction-modification methylase domain-containing protein n=1 Tax=Lactococcus lactis TaxID=1358 RepID=UPI003D2AA53D